MSSQKSPPEKLLNIFRSPPERRRRPCRAGSRSGCLFLPAGGQHRLEFAGHFIGQGILHFGAIEPDSEQVPSCSRISLKTSGNILVSLHPAHAEAIGIQCGAPSNRSCRAMPSTGANPMVDQAVVQHAARGIECIGLAVIVLVTALLFRQHALVHFIPLARRTFPEHLDMVLAACSPHPPSGYWAS